MDQSFKIKLNTERFHFVPYVNGVGVETHTENFILFPRSIKAITEDNEKWGTTKRVVVQDLFKLPEVEDNSLDYVVCLTLTDIDLDPLLAKLKPTGYLCLFNGEAEVYNKNGQLVIEELPEQRVLFIRYGAIGDLMQITSLIKQFKKMGYYTMVQAQTPASCVLENNPHLDKLIATDRENIRNADLRDYWDWLATQHPKVINLCGIVEDTLLPGKGSPRFYFPLDVRHRLMDYNYVELTHNVAGVGYIKKDFDVRFYPTEEEIAWAKAERATMPETKLICYSLSGSSIHKVYPHLDALVARCMLATDENKRLGFVTLGGDREALLESGWQNEPRVYKRAGIWSIRQMLTFVKLYADILIGPETGVMNAMCCEQMKKIVFLSHSTERNLTRDWTNTKSLFIPYHKLEDVCGGCCLHRLHMWDDYFKYLSKDETTGATKCQSAIPIDDVWSVVYTELKGKV